MEAVVVTDSVGQLASLHESLATLLASRGQWRQAYEHLRSALVLCRHQEGGTGIPEQLQLELDRLCREHAEAREQSLRDSLTASYNRRYLDQRLHDLMMAQPTGTGLAVAMVDLDFFKRVNDRHGHLVGDQVLRQVVEVLQGSLPDGAFCARYGGEEFALVLPDVGRAAAIVICEAARARIERHPWGRLVDGLHVTVSIGVAYREGTSPANPRQLGPRQLNPRQLNPRQCNGVPELLLSADQLLYQAKQSGRNAVAFRTPWGVGLAGMAAHRRAARVGLAELRPE